MNAVFAEVLASLGVGENSSREQISEALERECVLADLNGSRLKAATMKYFRSNLDEFMKEQGSGDYNFAVRSEEVFGSSLCR